MSVSKDVLKEISASGSKAGSQPVRVTSGGVTVDVNVADADRLGISVGGITVRRDPSLGAPADAGAAVERQAYGATQQINYLSERLSPVEVDPMLGAGVLRSNPPAQTDTGSEFFELSLNGGTEATLKRLKSERGTAGRTQENWTMTTDQFGKLVDDLSETVKING